MSKNALDLQKAEMLWNSGQALDAGEVLFEQIPNECRPGWAGRALQLVIQRSKIDDPVFDQVLQVSSTPPLWHNGHRIFRAIRGKVLKLDEIARTRELSSAEAKTNYVLALAELVAKVTYNATNPIDPFDSDSGWWIVSSMKAFAKHYWPDDEFNAKAWATVSSLAS